MMMPTGWLTSTILLKVLVRMCPGKPAHPQHEVLRGQVRDADGKWVARTSLEAEHPVELCRVVVEAFRKEAAAPFVPTPPVRISRRTAFDVLDEDRTRHYQREKANAEALGGLRSAAAAVEKLPAWEAAVKEVSCILDRVLGARADQAVRYVDCLGTDEAHDFDDEVLLTAREALEAWSGLAGPSFFDEMRKRAGDPETEVPKWLAGTTPLGILRPIRPVGVFPALTEADRQKALRTYPAKVPEPTPFRNYPCYQVHRATADAEFEKEVAKGYVKTFPSRAIMEREYGRVMPARVAALVKETPAGTKTRLIHDLSRAGVNQKVEIGERVVLPRACDVFDSIVRLAFRAKKGQSVWLFILDFADAFKHLHVHPSEMRFLAGWTANAGWFLYQVLFFGIVSGPLLWARVAALVMRMTNAMDHRTTDQHTFVDDPLAVTIGTEREAKMRFAKMALLWRVLGFKLSERKGAFGKQVAWIGLTVEVNDAFAKASINPAKIDKATTQIEIFMNAETLDRDALRLQRRCL